jgi:hypothetical protein
MIDTNSKNSNSNTSTLNRSEVVKTEEEILAEAIRQSQLQYQAEQEAKKDTCSLQ